MQWKVQLCTVHLLSQSLEVIIGWCIQNIAILQHIKHIDEIKAEKERFDVLCILYSACYLLYLTLFYSASISISGGNAKHPNETIHYLFMYHAQVFHMCWEYLNLIHASQFHNTTDGYTTQFVNPSEYIYAYLVSDHLLNWHVRCIYIACNERKK